eukprot:366448-Chlamydomonas_euryale.AAC.8
MCAPAAVAGLVTKWLRLRCGGVARCERRKAGRVGWAGRAGRGLAESSATRGCHEEGSGGGTAFRDFLKLTRHGILIPWL